MFHGFNTNGFSQIAPRRFGAPPFFFQPRPFHFGPLNLELFF